MEDGLQYFRMVFFKITNSNKPRKPTYCVQFSTVVASTVEGYQWLSGILLFFGVPCEMVCFMQFYPYRPTVHVINIPVRILVCIVV